MSNGFRNIATIDLFKVAIGAIDGALIVIIAGGQVKNEINFSQIVRFTRLEGNVNVAIGFIRRSIARKGRVIVIGERSVKEEVVFLTADRDGERSFFEQNGFTKWKATRKRHPSGVAKDTAATSSSRFG